MCSPTTLQDAADTHNWEGTGITAALRGPPPVECVSQMHMTCTLSKKFPVVREHSHPWQCSPQRTFMTQ